MKFWRAFFAFAAANNFIVGGAMLIGADQTAAQLGLSGAASGYVVGLAGLLIAMFGLAYAVVAWAPIANRNLVTIGAIGKASAAVLAAIHAYAGHIAPNVFLLACGDLIFALLFAVFLRQTRAAPASASAPARG